MAPPGNALFRAIDMRLDDENVGISRSFLVLVDICMAVMCFTVNVDYFKTFTCTIFLLYLTRTYGIVDS